jgi:uncharacterized membrane protein YgdD (TMEM256/DUF423 family)
VVSLFVRIAGIFGATAVAMGAYGAHVIHTSKKKTDREKEVYERANKYHLVHSLALLAVPLTAHPNICGSLFIIGIILFCGTCYINVMTGNKSVIRLTPVGGVTLIIAWLSMVYP